MDASVIDLRYKMKDVLKALDRKEKVTIRYHGKVKGIITPVGTRKVQKVRNHPFFGMTGNKTKSVSEQMETLRGNRYSDI